MHPTSNILCQIYNELHKRGQIKFTLGEKHKSQIDSVVKTVNASYFGVKRYPTTKDKAVAYFCFLIKDHPVTDGNKRLAVFWFELFCDINELQVRKLPFGLDVLAVAVEQSPYEIHEVISTTKAILFGSDV